MMHIPYIRESTGEHVHGTNQVYLMATRATEYSTPPAELQVGVPNGRGKATFPSRFRPCSPVTTRKERDLLMMDVCEWCGRQQAHDKVAREIKLSGSTGMPV
jgi:hypothetical protein